MSFETFGDAGCNHLDSSVWSEVSVWFTVYPMINFNYIKCSLWLMDSFFLLETIRPFLLLQTIK